MGFFDPIDDWLSEYICNPADVTYVDISLEMINGDSCKYLISILRKITHVSLKQKKFLFNWYYYEDENDILEIGKDLSYALNEPFNFIKVT